VLHADVRVVLVAEEQLAGLLRRLQGSRALQKRIAGVLVLPGSPTALSPAETFPLAEHAPYSERGYVWNPPGSGISSLDIGTPIFLLDEATAAAALRHATLNAQKVGRIMPELLVLSNPVALPGLLKSHSTHELGC
jgi:hypothetical protein